MIARRGIRTARSAGGAAALGALLCATLIACSPHSVVRDPTPPLKLPARYADAHVDSAPPQPPGRKRPGGRWWLAFRDPDLTRLVDSALSDSFDLQAAWARLAQANSSAEIAGAPHWPTLDLALGGTQTVTPAAAPQARFLGTRVTSASASLSAGYELDVWRKFSSGVEAGELDRAAAFDSVQALAMTLSAEVAEAWYDLVAARARRDVFEAQLEVNQTFVELLELRFAQGQASAVEVNQQRQQVPANRAALEQLEASERVLHHRLAVLLGRLPSRIQVGERAQLPPLPPLPAAGVPSELLKRRPDLRAAQRRVEAGDHRVAVAVADRYPRISLSASVSSQPSDFNDMLLDPLYNLAANLALPIIDGGRRAAEVERRRAIMAEAVADYGKAVLGALVEVENALAQERQQLRAIAQIEERLQVSTITLEQARQRYGQGLSDFLTVLTALRSYQEVQLSLVDARRQLLSHRIQLCRALGGTWSEGLTPPEERPS